MTPTDRLLREQDVTAVVRAKKKRPDCECPECWLFNDIIAAINALPAASEAKMGERRAKERRDAVITFVQKMSRLGQGPITVDDENQLIELLMTATRFQAAVDAEVRDGK